MMKRAWMGLALGLVALAGCKEESNDVSTDLINIAPSASNNTPSAELPSVQFTDTVFDFGIITEGEKVRHTFSFESVGDAPLIITKVEPSCGCTAVQDWSSRPYNVGETGTITIEFDSNKRPGRQQKTISVITNASPSVQTLHLQGDVIGPDAL